MADFTDSFMVDSAGDAKRRRTVDSTHDANAGAPAYNVKSKSGSEPKHVLTSSFAVKTTGKRVGVDVLFAFGVAAGYSEGGQVRFAYRELIVRDLVRPERQSPANMWQQRGYEMQWYDEFWSKHLDVFEWYEKVCRRDTVAMEYDVDHPGKSQAELDVENDVSKKRVRVGCQRGRLAEDGTKLTVVYTDEAMAFFIDRALRHVEKRSRNLRSVSICDMMAGFDVAHVDHLLVRHGYPSTQYTRVHQDAAAVLGRLCRSPIIQCDVNSYIYGLLRAGTLDNNDDDAAAAAASIDDVAAISTFKDHIKASTKTKSDHRVDHDAMHKVEFFLGIAHMGALLLDNIKAQSRAVLSPQLPS